MCDTENIEHGKNTYWRERGLKLETREHKVNDCNKKVELESVPDCGEVTEQMKNE